MIYITPRTPKKVSQRSVRQEPLSQNWQETDMRQQSIHQVQWPVYTCIQWTPWLGFREPAWPSGIYSIPNSVIAELALRTHRVIVLRGCKLRWCKCVSECVRSTWVWVLRQFAALWAMVTILWVLLLLLFLNLDTLFTHLPQTPG